MRQLVMGAGLSSSDKGLGFRFGSLGFNNSSLFAEYGLAEQPAGYQLQATKEGYRFDVRRYVR